MPIDTPAEQTLSDKRSGARTVRKGITQHIEMLKAKHAESDEKIEVLREVEDFIESMIERDKKRKGGLWN